MFRQKVKILSLFTDEHFTATVSLNTEKVVFSKFNQKHTTTKNTTETHTHTTPTQHPPTQTINK